MFSWWQPDKCHMLFLPLTTLHIIILTEMSLTFYTAHLYNRNDNSVFKIIKYWGEMDMDTNTKECPTCQQMIQVDAVFCPHCGARFVVVTKGYCPTCHAIREADRLNRCATCRGEVIDSHLESSYLGPSPVPGLSAAPVSTPLVTEVGSARASRENPGGSTLVTKKTSGQRLRKLLPYRRPCRPCTPADSPGNPPGFKRYAEPGGWLDAEK